MKGMCTSCACDSLIQYTTKFLLTKIFTEGSYFVLGQKFHPLHELLSRSCGWSSQVAMRVCLRSRTDVPKFSLCKKIRATACIGENFLLAKISAYTVPWNDCTSHYLMGFYSRSTEILASCSWALSSDSVCLLTNPWPCAIITSITNTHRIHYN